MIEKEINLITREGFEELQEKLHSLQTVERKSVVEEIERARGFGDISENAEFTYAQERQEQLESKIGEMVEFMKTCTVVDTFTGRDPDEGVVFGGSATILNLDTESSVSYRIVGVTESDPGEGKISYKSPMGRELLGKKIGDEFDLVTPRGESSWEVLEIS